MVGVTVFKVELLRAYKKFGTAYLCMLVVPEGIYNPITAMGFLAMFTFQLDNTKR